MKRRTFLAGSAALIGCGRGGPRLNVFNWSDYVAPNTIANFERETGIRVRYGTYESAPELLAKIMSGNSGWDVVFPSAEHIQAMRDMSLLTPLRHDWLPNLDALDPYFAAPPWDPQLRHSAPYMHGTTGISFQRTIKPKLTRWSDMWRSDLSGKITMLDEQSEVLGICLLMLGFSLNTGDPQQLRQAQKEASQQKQLVRAYLNAEVRDQLVAGDVLAGQTWAVTAAQAIAAAPDKLGYALPSEGFPRYADTIAILTESPRKEAAHKFVNYLLRAEVAADIVRTTQTATVNARAYALLSDAEKRNPVLYPSAAELSRGEWFAAQSAASQRLRDRIWTEIKSA